MFKVVESINFLLTIGVGSIIVYILLMMVVGYVIGDLNFVIETVKELLEYRLIVWIFICISVTVLFFYKGKN